MNEQVTCPACQSRMVWERRTIRYEREGIQITLENVWVSVCPECGQTAEVNEDGNCKNCISEQVMKFAVDNAKQAHKSGMDIGGLAPDLKAVKAARQEKDYDQVIAISERIVGNLEEILGEDLQGELNDRKAGKKRKKKRKKVSL